MPLFAFSQHKKSLIVNYPHLPSKACFKMLCRRASACCKAASIVSSILSQTVIFDSISATTWCCSSMEQYGTTRFSSVSKLMFFCAVAGAKAHKRTFWDSIKCFIYSGMIYSEGVNPTILSGKHASIPKNAVSAILAAIVIQSVPFGHNLLCCKPKLPYFWAHVVIYRFAAFTSPVWIKGYFPSSNKAGSLRGRCLDFPRPNSPSLDRAIYLHSGGIVGNVIVSSTDAQSKSISSI